MLQRFTTPLASQITAADTNVHNFALPKTGIEGGLVYLTTPSGNSGTVTIADGTNSGGLVLGAGVGISIPAVMLGPILHLNALSYQFSRAGDVLNLLVLG